MSPPTFASNGTAATPAANHRKRTSTILGAVASFVVFALALWFLHKEIAGLSREAVIGEIRSIPLAALLLMPAAQTAILGLPPVAVTLIGWLFLAVPVVYVALSLLRHKPVRISSSRLEYRDAVNLYRSAADLYSGR